MENFSYKKLEIEKKVLEDDILDSINTELLEKIIKNFTKITGISIEILSKKDKILASTNKKSICYKYFYLNESLNQNCYKHNCHSKIKDFKDFNDLCKIFKCHNMLYYAYIPIILKDEEIGRVLIKDFYLEKRPTQKEIIEFADKNNLESKELIKNINSIKVINEEELELYIEFIIDFAKLIGKLSLNKEVELYLKKELHSSESEIAANYEELIAIEEELRSQYDQLKLRESQLYESQQSLKKIYSTMNQGLALHEMIFDKEGNAIDYRFINVNPKFEELTGMKREDIIGKTVLEVMPNTEKYWIEAYAKVVQDGKTIIYENFSKELNRYYKVSAYRVEKNNFATLIEDISEKKLFDQKIKKAWMQTIESLGNVVELKDPYTSGHQKRVAELAKKIGKYMGFVDEKLDAIYMSGLLHDIGKISIPTEILTNPKRLSKEEFNLIKTHPQNGHDIIKDIDFPWDIKTIILQHHEKINGTGYPNGLLEADIRMEAKIISVADVVEAISSHRPYRPSLGVDFALKEIKSNKGILYDNHVVEAVLHLYNNGEISDII